MTDKKTFAHLTRDSEGEVSLQFQPAGEHGLDDNELEQALYCACDLLLSVKDQIKEGGIKHLGTSMKRKYGGTP